MWVLDTFYFACGTLLIVSLLHLVVFWVARFLYPPQPKVVQAPPPLQPTYIPQQPAPPPPFTQAYPPPTVVKQVVDRPELPPSYSETTVSTQVPVINNDPLPPPVQVGKRSENE